MFLWLRVNILKKRISLGIWFIVCYWRHWRGENWMIEIILGERDWIWRVRFWPRCLGCSLES